MIGPEAVSVVHRSPSPMTGVPPGPVPRERHLEKVGPPSTFDLRGVCKAGASCSRLAPLPPSLHPRPRGRVPGGYQGYAHSRVRKRSPLISVPPALCYGACAASSERVSSGRGLRLHEEGHAQAVGGGAALGPSPSRPPASWGGVLTPCYTYDFSQSETPDRAGAAQAGYWRSGEAGAAGTATSALRRAKTARELESRKLPLEAEGRVAPDKWRERE